MCLWNKLFLNPFDFFNELKNFLMVFPNIPIFLYVLWTFYFFSQKFNLYFIFFQLIFELLEFIRITYHFLDLSLIYPAFRIEIIDYDGHVLYLFVFMLQVDLIFVIAILLRSQHLLLNINIAVLGNEVTDEKLLLNLDIFKILLIERVFLL